MKPRLPQPATIISLVALTVALGGTATAATLIVTSKNIAKNAVKTRHIANGQITKAKLAKGVAISGPAGAAGAPGATGPRGLSAWNTIPSGTTVTGTFLWDLTAPASTGTQDFRFSVAFPAAAPQPLNAGAINFAADANASTTDDDPACNGSSGAPTAPAGKVCLYLNAVSASIVNGLNGQPSDELSDHAFTVSWGVGILGGSPADVFVGGTWAYTAP